jgi:hypothetical protein
MKKITIFVILIALLGTGVLGPLAWRQKWHAKVYRDGSSLEVARVYRNWSGDVLIDLTRAGGEIYVVDDRTVGIPNSPVIEVGPLAFGKYRRIKTIALGTAKTGFVDPRLLRGSQTLSFTNERGERIQVTWN